MNNKYYQALQTIKICIENIENHIGSTKIFEQYDNNLLIQQAVMRNIMAVSDLQAIWQKRKVMQSQ